MAMARSRASVIKSRYQGIDPLLFAAGEPSKANLDIRELPDRGLIEGRNCVSGRVVPVRSQNRQAAVSPRPVRESTGQRG